MNGNAGCSLEDWASMELSRCLLDDATWSNELIASPRLTGTTIKTAIAEALAIWYEALFRYRVDHSWTVTYHNQDRQPAPEVRSM